ncbi:MAG: DUF1232 domain-containing protein [Eubacteriales bacterium]
MLNKIKTKAKELKSNVLALYLASRHPCTPLFAKILTGLIVAYALSPIDLIPDFIPVLGLLDDIILLPLGIYIAIRMIPNDVLEQCREQAKQMEDKPKSYAAAVGIVLLWIAIAALILLKILK